MTTTSDKIPQTRVLVTGFGPFLNITTNPSWEIARSLPKSLLGHDGTEITIVVPSEATPAAYHKIFTQIPQLIQQYAPDLVIHMGLDVDSGPGVFKIERSAAKEGYHDIPDIDRKVFTRAENKRSFGKAPSSLITSLDIDTAHETWQYACSSLTLPTIPTASGGPRRSGKGKEKTSVNVQLSDDVGTYVCGFQYFVSMQALQKESGKRDVIFFHVPRLEGQEEVSVGVKVTEELIKALVSLSR